jgi:hypothetical protein
MNALRPIYTTRQMDAGLPDGFFSNQKSQFGQILKILRLETVNIFYGHMG